MSGQEGPTAVGWVGPILDADVLDQEPQGTVCIDPAGVIRQRRYGNSHMSGGWTQHGNHPIPSITLTEHNTRPVWLLRSPAPAPAVPVEPAATEHGFTVDEKPSILDGRYAIRSGDLIVAWATIGGDYADRLRAALAAPSPATGPDDATIERAAQAIFTARYGEAFDAETRPATAEEYRRDARVALAAAAPSPAPEEGPQRCPKCNDSGVVAGWEGEALDCPLGCEGDVIDRLVHGPLAAPGSTGTGEAP